MKTSLAEETLDVLEYAGKSPADVDLVAFSVEGVLRTCGLAAFLEAAVRMTYDPYSQPLLYCGTPDRSPLYDEPTFRVGLFLPAVQRR